MRGKDEFNKFKANASGDHPRLCGEKLNNDLAVQLHRGSPPPMRGKAPGVRVTVETSGITPAYAGKRNFCTCL